MSKRKTVQLGPKSKAMYYEKEAFVRIPLQRNEDLVIRNYIADNNLGVGEFFRLAGLAYIESRRKG